jgi:hypothetical protein
MEKSKPSEWMQPKCETRKLQAPEKDIFVGCDILIVMLMKSYVF